MPVGWMPEKMTRGRADGFVDSGSAGDDEVCRSLEVEAIDGKGEVDRCRGFEQVLLSAAEAARRCHAPVGKDIAMIVSGASHEGSTSGFKSS